MRSKQFLFVCGLIIFLLVGCSRQLSEKDMQTMIQDAQQRIQQADSMQVAVMGDLALQMPEADGGKKTDIALTMDIAYQKEQMGMAMQFGMDMLGTSLSGEMYIKDEAAYLDLLGQKMKIPLEGANISFSNELVTEMDFSGMTNWQAEKQDGHDVISCDLDTGFVEEEIAKQGQHADIRQMRCQYVLDGEDLLSMIIFLDVAVDDVSCQGELTTDFSNINAVKEIDYPDLSRYSESGMFEV